MKIRFAAFLLYIFLSGCSNPKNLYQFLHDTNFDETGFTIIRHDNKERELRDINAFLLAAKEAKKSNNSICFPHYELILNIGSSFASQIMNISLCSSGEGKAVQGGPLGKAFTFSSPQIYSLVETEFLKNLGFKEFFIGQ